MIEHLQKEKYIDRRKTISTGWSNGGMVVAAAAMQRPDLYALVVPGAGVQDYLDAIKTDKRYQGWKFEYGDPYGPDRQFMKLVGPVSLAQQGKGQGPIWFYVGGTNDSRVNPSNSHKAALAAQKAYADPSRVRRFTMKNSGHWMTSQLYQDVIAWGSQSIIWSYIFTTAGMTLGE